MRTLYGLTQTLRIVLTAVNASLYAVVGFTYLGIVVFGVKFWPAVVVPAVFAVLFGPRVGAAGASIGIFISDMFTHGMPLLSLSVGVPANFALFYIIGYFTNRYSFRRYVAASISGLAIGSSIIGVGIWAWSQVFLLPGTTQVTPLPLFVALSTFAWTFLSEIPFLIILVPPVVLTVRKSVPSLSKP